MKTNYEAVQKLQVEEKQLRYGLTANGAAFKEAEAKVKGLKEAVFNGVPGAQTELDAANTALGTLKQERSTMEGRLQQVNMDKAELVRRDSLVTSLVHEHSLTAEQADMLSQSEREEKPLREFARQLAANNAAAARQSQSFEFNPPGGVKW